MPADLLATCIAAHSKGQGFASIYRTIIARHPFFGGVLKTETDGTRTWLAVPLIGGGTLVYESSKDEFRLAGRIEHRSSPSR
jgi:hypothetical protein